MADTSMSQAEVDAMLGALADEGKGRSTFYKFKEGKNVVRILPPNKKLSEKSFFLKLRKHWLGRTPLTCWEQELAIVGHKSKKSCIDKEAQKWWNAGEKGSQEWELAKSLSPNDEIYARAVIKSDDEFKSKPTWVKIPAGAFTVIKEALTENRDEYGNIIDAFVGRDLIINRKGTGKTTKYTYSISGTITPVHQSKEELLKILAQASGMAYSALIEIPSEDEMNEALAQWNEAKGLKPTSRPAAAPVTEEMVDETPVNDITEFTQSEDTADSAIDDALSEFL